MASSSLSFLLLFSLLTTSNSLSLSAAIAALSSANFTTSFSLTLDLASQTLSLPSLQTLTLFAPSDAAFLSSGQPPLSLLSFHLSPRRLPFQTLAVLPRGSQIQTLTDSYNLTVTAAASSGEVAFNGVKIDGVPVFDDGFVVAYVIDRFFDTNFDPSVLQGTGLSLSPQLGCKALVLIGSFIGAENKIRPIGYSLFATYLDLQLLRNETVAMTVFAPLDVALMGYVGNFSDGSVGVLRRHVVPCRIGREDLEKLGAGTMLSTFETGFEINVDRFGGMVLLNGVGIDVYEMYSDEFLVVHGIKDVLQQLLTSVEFG